jgi:hypothetical protein
MAKDDGLEEILQSSTNMVEILKFYNDTVELRYDDKLHAYYREEEAHRYLVPGVTTITGMIDKSAALTQWAANKTVESIIEQLAPPSEKPWVQNEGFDLRANYESVKAKEPVGDTSTLAIETGEFAAILNKARFNFRDISKDATDVGKMAHDWLENYLKWCIQLNYICTPATVVAYTLYAGDYKEVLSDERAIRCVDAALGWLFKHQVRAVKSESKIFHREYNYAGTLDLLCHIHSCGDHACCPFDGDVFGLLDFKSSAAIYDEYRLQLAAYSAAWSHEFPDHEPIGVHVILRLGKNDGEFDSATYTEEVFQFDFEGFLGALQTYNWVKQAQLVKKMMKPVKEKKVGAKAPAKKKPSVKVNKILVGPAVTEPSSFGNIPIGV